MFNVHFNYRTVSLIFTKHDPYVMPVNAILCYLLIPYNQQQ